MAKKGEIDQAETIKVGDKIPDGTFLVMDENEPEPHVVNVKDIVGKGKGRVVFFGLPGAYTSVCSSKHVPQYNAKADELKSEGVSAICCLSVNDAYVMRDWAKQLGVSTKNVALLADGEGDYHAKLGLLQYLPGLGNRARRYSMLINEDGTVEVLNLEEPGGKSYVVSGPDHMLGDIRNLKTQAKVNA
jgi:peroxiredoxin